MSNENYVSKKKRERKETYERAAENSTVSNDLISEIETRAKVCATDAQKKELAFAGYRLDDDIEQKINQFCGTDDKLANDFKRAYFASETWLNKQFVVVIYKHNDLEGKFNILITNQCFDIPDLNKLSAGRYRICLKYYDWYQKAKGGRYGAIKTVWRDIIKEGDPSEREEGKGVRGAQIEPSVPLIPNYKEYLAEVDRLYKEALEYNMETMRTRQEIEKAAYERGYQAGKMQGAAEAASITPAQPADNTFLLSLLKDAFAGNSNS